MYHFGVDTICSVFISVRGWLIYCSLSYVRDSCGLSHQSCPFVSYHKCHMFSIFVVAHVGRVYLHFVTNVTCFRPCVVAHVGRVYFHFITNVTCSHYARSGWARRCSARQVFSELNWETFSSLINWYWEYSENWLGKMLMLGMLGSICVVGNILTISVEKNF